MPPFADSLLRIMDRMPPKTRPNFPGRALVMAVLISPMVVPVVITAASLFFFYDNPLVVTAMLRPQDIESVRAGMDARVRLQGVSQRWMSPLPAKVTTVSADRLVNDKTGEGYFRADLRIDPRDVVKLGKGVRMTPGMPAETMIVTGERTVLGYLLSPITDTLSHAFREQ